MLQDQIIAASLFSALCLFLGYKLAHDNVSMFGAGAFVLWAWLAIPIGYLIGTIFSRWQ
jgi:hypothetical protein